MTEVEVDSVVAAPASEEAVAETTAPETTANGTDTDAEKAAPAASSKKAKAVPVKKAAPAKKAAKASPVVADRPQYALSSNSKLAQSRIFLIPPDTLNIFNIFAHL